MSTVGDSGSSADSSVTFKQVPGRAPLSSSWKCRLSYMISVGLSGSNSRSLHLSEHWLCSLDPKVLFPGWICLPSPIWPLSSGPSPLSYVDTASGLYPNKPRARGKPKATDSSLMQSSVHLFSSPCPQEFATGSWSQWMLGKLRRGDIAMGWVREVFLEAVGSELDLELLERIWIGE